MHDDSPILRIGTSELDMLKRQDRGLAMRAFVGYPGQYKKRWEGIDEDTKATFVRALKVALRMATEKNDHRAMIGCVETLRRLEADNQADEHLEYRAATGVQDVTNVTKIEVVYVNGQNRTPDSSCGPS